jgi:ribosome-binding factor A
VPRRLERLGEQFKREVAHLLRSQVRDPRVLGVTITGVEVSRDLTFARIYVHVSGTEEERSSALEGLTAAAPFFRRHLSAVLRIRRVPELDFQEDRTLAHARRIDELLREVGPVPPESSAESELADGIDDDLSGDEALDGDEVLDEDDVSEEDGEEKP